MALIICPECGKQISDRATTCVNCGCPIDVAKQDEASKDDTDNQIINDTGDKKKQSFWKTAWEEGKEQTRKKQEQAKEQAREQQELQKLMMERERSFKQSKALKIAKMEIGIDEKNKLFSIKEGSKKQVYTYNDLTDFELTEDGNSILQGKSVSSAVGALTFGLAGALIGSAGKKKQSSTCSRLTLRIYLNDLNKPQVAIDLITYEVKKDSRIYKDAIDKAKEAVAILNIIKASS